MAAAAASAASAATTASDASKKFVFPISYDYNPNRADIDESWIAPQEIYEKEYIKQKYKPGNQECQELKILKRNTCHAVDVGEKYKAAASYCTEKDKQDKLKQKHNDFITCRNLRAELLISGCYIYNDDKDHFSPIAKQEESAQKCRDLLHKKKYVYHNTTAEQALRSEARDLDSTLKKEQQQLKEAMSASFKFYEKKDAKPKDSETSSKSDYSHDIDVIGLCKITSEPNNAIDLTPYLKKSGKIRNPFYTANLDMGMTDTSLISIIKRLINKKYDEFLSYYFCKYQMSLKKSSKDKEQKHKEYLEVHETLKIEFFFKEDGKEGKSIKLDNQNARSILQYFEPFNIQNIFLKRRGAEQLPATFGPVEWDKEDSQNYFILKEKESANSSASSSASASASSASGESTSESRFKVRIETGEIIEEDEPDFLDSPLSYGSVTGSQADTETPTATATPSSPPNKWFRQIDATGKHYYFNPSTQTFADTLPPGAVLGDNSPSASSAASSAAASQDASKQGKRGHHRRSKQRVGSVCGRAKVAPIRRSHKRKRKSIRKNRR
jgi:hypothetical protein